MLEQDIKQLLYKEIQRYKKLLDRIIILEKQVLLMHKHLTSTTKQVVALGDALVKFTGGEAKDDNAN